MGTRNLLLMILAVGLFLRLGLLLFFWDKPLTIVDEIQYQQLSENILKHHEYSFHLGQPTALRPPLYPAFLSTVYFVTGGIHYNAVRITQIFLSLGAIWMVFVLGRRIFDEKTGVLAAFIFSIYPSFLFITHFLLTEILFTFLLLLFVYFFLCFLDSNYFKESGSRPHLYAWRYALLSGLFLGLGALTRSILYPFLVVAILIILLGSRGTMSEKIKGAILLTIGFVVFVCPWAARNYTLYRSFVPVGTMGGLNLFMGNYEHTPLNRAWAAVDLTGEKAWHHGHEDVLSGMNEAQKQKWASKKAKEFILDNKLLTIKRDLIKAANLWGLERAVLGPIINGHWPQLKKTHYLVIITLSIFSIYAAVILASSFGIVFHVQLKRHDIILILILLAYFTGMHAIVFGHSRYHLPLIPLLAVFAAWSVRNLGTIWEHRNEWRQRISVLLTLVFLAVWTREIVFVEGARYLGNIRF